MRQKRRPNLAFSRTNKPGTTKGCVIILISSFKKSKVFLNMQRDTFWKFSSNLVPINIRRVTYEILMLMGRGVNVLMPERSFKVANVFFQSRNHL